MGDNFSVYSFHRMLLEQKHLMIAGATGSGKSVIVNGMIYTAMIKKPSFEAGGTSFILIDPKRVELVEYKDAPHTTFYASEPDDMIDALKLGLGIVEYRFKQMREREEKLFSGGDLYIFIDEFADLMTTQRKKVVPLVQRIAQIGRASKVHLVLCTQCPIAKIIPTEIKCNFDSVLGLRTVNKQQSRNVIGEPGLETLPMYGSAVFSAPGVFQRYDGIPLIPEREIKRLIDRWKEILE